MGLFDCQACGACCTNTARNRALGTLEYIEVTREDALYREAREMLRALGARSTDGRWHLTLVGEEQRCTALEGELGEGVSCGIYRLRPSGCRQVEAGDGECLEARRRLGLPLTRSGERARLA